MPLDAICLRAVLHELRPQLIGARIDKVQQPARDQIVLLLRGNLRLLLNAGARPGMVTYDNYRTLYVTPEEGLVKKLFLR